MKKNFSSYQMVEFGCFSCLFWDKEEKICSLMNEETDENDYCEKYEQDEVEPTYMKRKRKRKEME